MINIIIVYIWIFIHRPFEVWSALGAIRLERVYMLGALVALALHPKKRWLPNVQHGAYFAFSLAVLLSWALSPWPDWGQTAVENYFKQVIFYIMVVWVIHDEKNLKNLVLAYLISNFIYFSHSLIEYRNGRHEYRMGIIRMIGVDGTYSEPNTFGGTIVYALPFVIPFLACGPSRRMRAFLAAYFSLSVVCVALTGSRSALVSLSAGIALMVLRSRRRWALLGISVPLIAVLWSVLPPKLQNRFETIIHPEVGSKTALDSAMGRINGFYTGIDLISRYPVSGCGPGAWRRASGSSIESHNLYGQLMGEMGLVGVATFALVLLGFLVNLRWVGAAYRSHPAWEKDFLYYLSVSVGLALPIMLLEGCFGHNLYRYNWLWFGGFLIITRYCIEQRIAAESPWTGPVPVRRPART